MEKPTILIIHGPWHQPLHYRPLVECLRQDGYNVLIPNLATSGYDDSIVGKSHLDDVKRINEALYPVLGRGKEVVLVSHSYGAIPATEVTELQSVEERAARGSKGGIRAIIYISPMPALVKDVSPFEASGGQWLSNTLFDVEEWRLPLNLKVASELFYHDVEDEEMKQVAVAALAGHSHEAYRVPMKFSMQEVTVPKIFVACKKDKVIPIKLQKIFVREIQPQEVHELDTGHDPFLARKGLEKLISIIEETAHRPLAEK